MCLGIPGRIVETHDDRGTPMATVDFGGNDYAAQTYDNIPAEDGRRIQFAWQYKGMQ